MTQQTVGGARGLIARAQQTAARLPWQPLALVAAALLAANGARILNDSPVRIVPILDNFDAAMPWLGAALLLLLLAACLPLRARLPSRDALRAWWDAHQVEVALFVVIIAFGIFMRVYRFGDTLPPSNGICCEEHINGGTAYAALQGERPLLFPLGRWASAAGFLIFGENTLGLRFFFPIMSIATLGTFYLLARQLVRAQAALFTLTLYASAWWPSLRARQATEGLIYVVLFTYFLVRVLRTRSPVPALGLGVLAGLLSYEYEPFRAVPLIAVAFLAAAAAREVLLRAPLRLDAALERARDLLRLSWRPALFCVFAAGIVLTPMAVGLSKGYDLYLTSVHRQEADRGGDLLAGNWQDHAKWGAELFLPFGPKDYPTQPPREVSGKSLLDPLTASLAVVALAAGVVLFRRGFRSLFVGWFFISITVGSLLLQNFAPWKFLVLAPVLLVLTAYLVDDACAFVERRYSVSGRRVFEGLLVAGALFSLWWNADALFNDVAPSEAWQQGYAGENGMIYGLCDYMQSRGAGTYNVSFMDAPAIPGFAAPHETFAEQGTSWRDFLWVCHDLEGEAVAAPEEAWPLRALPGGKLALAFGSAPALPDDVVAQLNRAYPGLGEPNRSIAGPADGYDVLGYEFAAPADLWQPGLWGEYFAPGSATPFASGVDPVNPGLSLARGQPAPFAVHWRGLVYIGETGSHGFRGDTAEPVVITIDGRPVYDTTAGTQQASVDLAQGWHVVEITLDVRHDNASFGLVLVQPDGSSRDAGIDELFPLAELSGWLHERSFGFPGTPRDVVTHRFDFAPHFALAPVLKLLAGEPEGFVTEDRWQGVWDVTEAGRYTLLVQFKGGTMTMLLDGVEQGTSESINGAESGSGVDLPVEPGRHTIELIQQFDNDVLWSGATFSIRDSGAGAPTEQKITPY